MYDPVIGLFTTADIMVQNFSDPQALNRYSYCHNNPLYYVDPSGHIAWAAVGLFIAHVAAGAVIGAAIGSAFAAITGQDIGQGALTGAITGAFFGGAGGYIDVANISLVTQKVAIHALAGAAGGAASASAINGNVGMAALTGGISGGVGKFAGGFMDKWNWGAQLAGRSLVGGITGGVAAEMYGGKFMDGFVMGAESAAFGMVCNEVVQLGLSVNWGAILGSTKGFGFIFSRNPETGEWQFGGYSKVGGGTYGGGSVSVDGELTVSRNNEVASHGDYSISSGGSATVMSFPGPFNAGGELGFDKNVPLQLGIKPSYTYMAGVSAGTMAEGHTFLTYTHVVKWFSWKW